MPSQMARAVLWFVALLCAIFSPGQCFAAETPKGGQSEAQEPLKRPENPAAQPSPAFPWRFSATKAFEVERTEDIKTKLGGREVWYKSRLPARTEMTVALGSPAEPSQGPSGPRVTVGVKKLYREIQAEGPERTLRFDVGVYDERSDGKRVKYLNAGASAAEKQEMRNVTQLPWYALEGVAGAWSRGTVAAEGEAWPLADALRLDRETMLILPPVKLDGWTKDMPLRHSAALPFPAPLFPVPSAEVTYRIRDITGSGSERVAAVEFSGRGAAERKAIEWAGIPLPDAKVKCTVSGSLKVTMASQDLLEARLNLLVEVSKAGAEPFEAHYKLESSWKAAR